MGCAPIARGERVLPRRALTLALSSCCLAVVYIHYIYIIINLGKLVRIDKTYNRDMRFLLSHFDFRGKRNLKLPVRIRSRKPPFR